MNINAGRCINGNLFEIKSVQVYSTAISDLFYDFVASFASAIVNEKKKKISMSRSASLLAFASSGVFIDF